jgi:antirestriction protein
LIKAVTDVGDVESIEKIQEYLRLLNEYRIKCENEGNFPEANRALAKFEELRIREQQKVEDNIKHNQMEEIKYLEDLHKKQFLDFSEAWDQ